MSEAKATEILNDLTKIVTRLFYDDKYAIVMDMFTGERVFRDDVLAYRLKLNSKELNRILARLKDDRLLKAEVRFEKTAAYDYGKVFTKSYYYLDYKQLVEVVKYKVFKMRRYFEDMMRSNLEQVGYHCQRCNKIYNPLEVQSMLDMTSFLFRCELCKSELVEHRNERLKNGPQEAHTRLMDQCAMLIELLKRTENIAVPHFDVVRWIESNPDAPSVQIPDTIKTMLGANSDDSIPSTPLSASGERKEAIPIDVELLDEDRLTGTSKKSALFDNSLPLWHTQSAVSLKADLPENSEPDDTAAESFSIKSAPEIASEPTSTTERAPLDNSEKVAQDYAEYIKNHKEETKPISSSALNESSVMISVAGIQKPFSEITEEDKNKMSADEYSAYYQLFMENEQQ